MMRILRRAVAIFPAVLLEALLIALLFTWANPWAAQIEAAMRLMAFLLTLFVISYRREGTYKILWILFFNAFPVPAAFAYLMWGNKRTAVPIVMRIGLAGKELESARDFLPNSQNNKLPENVSPQDRRIAQSIGYLAKLSGFEPMPCESAKYYPLGEACWQAMLDEMRKAKKFIYLEYFIVEDGVMWRAMTQIMAQKVKEGVDVRFIYDDFGSLTTFSRTDTKKLDEIGVRWLAFNKLKFISGTLNNRSHRKMLIIDGAVAFSGGINLADEYINKTVKFGHWKDIGFKITGSAVAEYLCMFALFWNAYADDKIPAEIFGAVPAAGGAQDGVVLSYCDSPANRDSVSNNFYVEMLGNAERYAWFYTPYLMLGDTLMDAFVRAAQRGVDVRIIMPGVPDKKLVFRLSRSFYRPLLEAGVKIYQYIPGFVHAKASLYDDELCTIGTVNLDYRSLYLHFENNSVFWHSSILNDLKADYLHTLELCREVKKEDLKRGLFGSILDGVLRVFAPLC